MNYTFQEFSYNLTLTVIAFSTASDRSFLIIVNNQVKFKSFYTLQKIEILSIIFNKWSSYWSIVVLDK